MTLHKLSMVAAFTSAVVSSSSAGRGAGVAGLLLVAGWAEPARASAGAQDRLPMPCLQLVSREAVTASLGDGFTLTSAAESKPGDSICVWESAAQGGSQAVRLTFMDRRGFPADSPSAAAAFDLEVAALARNGLTAEPIAGLGEQAVLFTVGETPLIVVRRPDGVVRVAAMRASREQALALARRAAAPPPPVLGTHTTIPEPEPIVAAIALALSPEMLRVPCVTLLTQSDVRAARRPEVLVDVREPRPGYSACEWRSTSADPSGFSFAAVTGEGFAAEHMAGAVEYFAAERKLVADLGGCDPLPGVGEEAFVTKATRAWPLVVVRRRTDVLKVQCIDCSRDEAISLARRAAAR